MLTKLGRAPACLLYLISLPLSISCFYGVFTCLYRHSVNDADNLHSNFPVLIFTAALDGEYEWDMVYWFNIRDHKVADGYTFLIPVGKEAEINRELANSGASPRGIGSVEIEYLSDGRQRIKATKNSRYPYRSDIGWYVASDHQIVPEYHVDHWPLRNLIMAFPIGFAVSTLAYGIMYSRRKRRMHE